MAGKPHAGLQRTPEWEGNNSLPAVLARAQIAALQTVGDSEARFAAKWKLVRGLYSAGYSKEELREAFRLIDWMMKLQQRLSDRFNEEIKRYEEEIDMPFVPSFERRALSKGREEGREQGRREEALKTALLVLEKKFGKVASTDAKQVQRLTLEQLRELSQAAFDFTSKAELHDWLQKAAK